MREVLGEVLSDLFTKHLPREKSSNQRDFERESEVVRSFLVFFFLGSYIYYLATLLRYSVKCPAGNFLPFGWRPGSPPLKGRGWGGDCVVFYFTLSPSIPFSFKY